MSNDEDGLWNAIVTIGLIALAIALALWFYRSEYRDCMKVKNDEIICRTFVNSMF